MPVVIRGDLTNRGVECHVHRVSDTSELQAPSFRRGMVWSAAMKIGPRTPPPVSFPVASGTGSRASVPVGSNAVGGAGGIPGAPSLRLIRPEAGTSQRLRVSGVLSPTRVKAPAQFVWTDQHNPPADDHDQPVIPFSALDPRWVLAVAVSRELEGVSSLSTTPPPTPVPRSSQAIIAPESRSRLLASGKRLGLRDFDTSLIIAIVQDNARRGLDPLGHGAMSSLQLIGVSHPDQSSKRGITWPIAVIWMLASAWAGAIVAVMVMLLL